MGKTRKGAVCLLQLWFALFNLAGDLVDGVVKQFNRYDFPPDFVFGAGTASYQVEGAAFQDGRKASIFDTFAHYGRVTGNGDIACDEYHKYKEDVQLMMETGLDVYRLSISWSRLIPDGRGLVNPKGLEYYNHLIDELILHGIQPHITLLHCDVPQVLEDAYGGLLNRRIIEDFTEYAEVCFKEFGDRVKYWTTINEPNIFILGGYDQGILPPLRCSSPFGTNCTNGNSTTEPYLVAHNALLAHASIARLYKEKYQAKQHGFIGFNLYATHYIPMRDKIEDVIAARRCYDSSVGWFMHPLTHGDYPDVMKRNAGTRIPSFTKNESELVKGAFDFIGINYYDVCVVKDNSVNLTTEPSDYLADMKAVTLIYNGTGSNGSSVPKGPHAVTPWGLQGVLEHFKDVYGNPPIYIHENGQAGSYNASINDTSRVEYLQAHVGGLLGALRNGSNTKGYFIWSFMDVFELLFGYDYSYGLYYIDRNDPNLTRYPKLSQRWYSAFLKGANVTIYDESDEAENIPTVLRITPLDVDRHQIN